MQCIHPELRRQQSNPSAGVEEMHPVYSKWYYSDSPAIRFTVNPPLRNGHNQNDTVSLMTRDASQYQKALFARHMTNAAGGCQSPTRSNKQEHFRPRSVASGKSVREERHDDYSATTSTGSPLIFHRYSDTHICISESSFTSFLATADSRESDMWQSTCDGCLKKLSQFLIFNLSSNDNCLLALKRIGLYPNVLKAVLWGHSPTHQSSPSLVSTSFPDTNITELLAHNRSLHFTEASIPHIYSMHEE